MSSTYDAVRARLEQDAERSRRRVRQDDAVNPSAERVRERDGVPRPLHVAAAWSWRLLAVGVGVVALGWVAGVFSDVTIPVAIAILLCAGLTPIKNVLRRLRFPHWLAALSSLLLTFAVLAGLITLVGTQAASEAPALADAAVQGFAQFTTWLAEGPLHVNDQQLAQYTSRITQVISNSQGRIAALAATFGSTIATVTTGALIAIFALFFFLSSGREMWGVALRLAPAGARPAIDDAALRGWRSLAAYVRATILVALVDALGVLVTALVLGVPMAFALAVLIFLGAFIPLVGAFVTGFVAVLVALVTLGPVQALIMLIAITAVMQLEGNVLQPFLLGKAVDLHPLVVLLSIAVGITLGGIVGALLIVPALAFGKAFVSRLTVLRDERAGVAPPDAEG